MNLYDEFRLLQSVQCKIVHKWTNFLLWGRSDPNTLKHFHVGCFLEGRSKDAFEQEEEVG